MTKLKKQLILSGIILVIVAILAAVYFIATSSDADVDGTKREERDSFGVLMKNGRHFIVDPIEVSDLNWIKVHNTEDEYTLVRKTTGAWAFEGTTGFEPDAEKLSLLRTNTRYLLSVEYVENADLENTDKYGIDPDAPLVWFEVDHHDGERYTVFVGDETPDGIGYYAMLKGRDAIYILDTGLKESVLLTLQDYITPTVVAAIPTTEQNALEWVELYKGDERFIRAELVKDKLTHGNNSTHRMVFPVENYATSLANFSSFLDAMAKISCDETVAFGERLTEDMIVSLGFSAREDGGRECDYTLHAQYPTQEIKLHIIDEGDTYLVYAPLRQTVCRAQKTVFPFLEWELISWVSSEIYMLDIMDVATVSFKGNGTEALFELSGDVDLEVKCAGKSVDVEAFKKTYQAFMYVLVTDWGEEPEDAAELMHLTFTMESGEVLDYSFKAVTAVKSFYTLNGAGQFYIEREKVMEIRGLFEALIP